MKGALAGLAAVLLIAGCESAAPRVESPAIARFFLESSNGAGTTVTLPRSGVRVVVGPKPMLTEYDVLAVEVTRVELGRCLRFQLTPAAARDLLPLSEANVGRRLVLVLDGAPLGARRIERPLADGVVAIFVETPDDTLPLLAERLRITAADMQRRARKS